MPLPTDEKIVTTANALVGQLHSVFGKHQNKRATHAKGFLLNGAFVPTEEASSLSIAPHFQHASTPVVVRFSSSTGIPNLPDNDGNGEPRGIGIRFVLGEHRHTDIIAHSTPHFPTRTGEGFLALLKAIEASPAGTPSPSPVEQFLGREENAAALRFVKAPKPIAGSFATLKYFGLNAYKLVHEEKYTYIRYQVVPVAGEHHLDENKAKEQGADFLHEEIKARVTKSPIEFKLLAQIGEDGDVTDDVTQEWPEARKLVELGTIKLDSLETNDAEVQRKIIFDPIPRVQGIEPSNDPLLEMRAAVYLISGRERR